MQLFASCYKAFAARRSVPVLVLIVLLLICGWILGGIQINNDIRSLLPDGDSHVAKEFELLGQAPLSRKLVIQLHAAEEVPRQQLLAETRRFAERLQESGEIRVQQLDQQLMTALIGQLQDSLPLFLDAHDWTEIEAQLSPEKIDAALAEDKLLLVQPQGMLMKQRVRRDPLDFQRLVLAKLKALNPVPEAKLEQGQFVSKDGRNTLLLAETSIPITDVNGAEALLEQFTTLKGGLAEGITADLLSGHLYTLENARAIQQDMRIVLIASSLGLLVIFVLFLRRLSAIAVYLLPLVALLVATAATQLYYGSVSGITFGFGAVLLGITIDYGLHVYYPLVRTGKDRGQILAGLAKPMLTGGLTTVAGFAVLLWSVLPGQRQLAFFSIAGIFAALLLALCILPHFVRRQGEAWEFRGQQQAIRPLGRGRRRVVLLCWLVVMLAALTQIGQLKINGELRQLSYVPAYLQQAETNLKENWGDLRSSAMIFSSGASWNEAFSRNEQLWQTLRSEQLDQQAVSLAPLLIADEVQQQRQEHWQRFWLEHAESVSTSLEQSRQNYGFSAEAFSPFVASWTEPGELIDWQTRYGGGLKSLIEDFVFSDSGGYRVISLIPDNPELISRLAVALDGIPGLELVSQSRFGSLLGEEIFHDFKRFILLASGVIVVLLLVVLRSLKRMLLTLLPVVSGIIFMLGGMAWLGLEINIFNVIASILVIGLGVDYGVFMVSRGDDGHEYKARVKAISVSGLTTLAGFGALALASHPALSSIGITVLLGILAAVPSAVLVLPALTRREGGRT